MLTPDSEQINAWLERVVALARRYFHAGGKFNHLLEEGQNAITDGVPALVGAYEGLERENEYLKKRVALLEDRLRDESILYIKNKGREGRRES